MGHRIAAGMPERRAAQAEGLADDDLDGILADPAFAELVEACRRIRAMSREERLERLTSLALDALEVAMADGDPRIMLCFVALRRAGLDPAAALAERVLRQDERARAALARPAGEGPPAEAARPRRRPRPRRPDPVGSALAAGAARLGAALRLEHALHHAGGAPLPGPGGRPPSAATRRPEPSSLASAATGTAARSTTPAASPSPPPSAPERHPNRRQRRRLAAERRKVGPSGGTGPPPGRR